MVSATGDYAMQNVLLQMNLRLLTPDGMRISELRRWGLRCHACGDVVRETTRASGFSRMLWRAAAASVRAVALAPARLVLALARHQTMRRLSLHGTRVCAVGIDSILGHSPSLRVLRGEDLCGNQNFTAHSC